MNQVIRKCIVVLLFFFLAGYIVSASDRRNESTFFGENSPCYSSLHENHGIPSVILGELAQHLGTSGGAAAGFLEDSNDAVRTILSAAAENISSLSDFIQAQNSDVSRGSSLVQANAFLKYSLKYNVPLDLVVAVAHTESHFRPGARSAAGAAGIMQVMWKVHAGLLQANGIMNEEDLNDPEMGIAAGSLLISRYLKAYGDTKTALGRYYGGPASVYWGRVSRNLAKIQNAKLVAAF